MKKVLVFSYLPRHLKKILSVVKEFLKDNRIEVTLVFMTQEERKIAIQENIPYKMLDEFTSKKRMQDFDLAWGIEPLIHAIESIKPDLFIAMEVNYILRNAIRFCKLNSIPNIVIQHGTPNDFSLHAFAPFEGDCFLAWGEFTKEYLIKNYVDENKIILTGGIPFDGLREIIPNRKNIAKEIGCDPTKKWFVFTTQGTGAGGKPSYEQIYDGVVETAKFISQCRSSELIYQVHPNQDIKEIQEILNTVDSKNCYVTKYNFTEELIAASEGMITFFSTTAIDCTLLGKPLLLINLNGDENFLPFAKMGAAFLAISKTEIKDVFQRMYNDSSILVEKQKKAAKYVNFKNDGKALSRVMKVCYQKLKI